MSIKAISYALLSPPLFMKLKRTLLLKDENKDRTSTPMLFVLPPFKATVPHPQLKTKAEVLRAEALIDQQPLDGTWVFNLAFSTIPNGSLQNEGRIYGTKYLYKTTIEKINSSK